MMNKNTFTILTEEFENDKTNEKVPGITIIIDGTLREVFDLFMRSNSKYKTYTDIVSDALINGINVMMAGQKNDIQ